ncbi:MAG: acyltransferase [Bacteroidetes bacterium]|nr:acyltransferase [Bacteroidota bacterium]
MQNRNYGLDIVRAISIWLVLLQHTGVSPGGLKIGALGVEVFFVLSGFLIGQILLREVRKENSFHTLKKFWIRRWFRILPVYYLVLFTKLFFFGPFIGLKILYYVFFLQNNFYGIDFYNVTWSLVVEEWFYIFAPLFLMIAFYFSGHNPVRLLLWLVVFLIAENIFRLGYVLRRDTPFGGVNGNFPFRFDSLFCGVFIAFLRQEVQHVYARMRSVFYFIAGILFIAAYVFYIHSIIAPTDMRDHLIFPRTIGFFIFSISIAITIPFIEQLKFPSDNIAAKIPFHFFTQTSLLTYSIYLIHPLVFPYFISKTSSTFHAALAIVVVYACAFVIYYSFEKPVLKLRERFA